MFIKNVNQRKRDLYDDFGNLAQNQIIPGKVSQTCNKDERSQKKILRNAIALKSAVSALVDII